MSEMGYGLSRDIVMHLAFTIVDKTQRKHPFKDGKAGRAWFDGFRRRHPRLTIRSPQPLSYCRALCSNMDTINDFFSKLGSIYGRLNVISKPMQVYNCDETGVSIVHKPGKVIAQLGRRNVYAITSAERGKTHTVVSCVSASGYSLSPMIVYPRKKCVPENCKEGAIPNTFFANSANGWINTELYLQWFDFFLRSIPPTRPVLLIQDGHVSHMSVKLIELARANNIHLLCLPSHTSHILQPLDVGVFKSFKSNFSKACSRYLAAHPGRVITTDKLASLVAECWPNSFTAVNIMSSFKKSGVFPFNPGVVTDRQVAPSKGLRQQTPEIDHKDMDSEEPTSNSSIPLFSPEKEALYRKRYEEHYDIHDPSYVAWLKINHPEAEVSESLSETSSSLVSGNHVSHSSKYGCESIHSSTNSSKSKTSSSDVLSDILVLPRPITRAKSRGKPALNSKRTVCITDDEILEELKLKEFEKAEAEKKKEAKQLERVQKRKVRELKQLESEQKRERGDKQLQKKENEEKQLVRDQIREEQNGRKGEKKKEIEAKEESKKTEKEKEAGNVKVLSLVHKVTEIQLSDNDDSSESEEDTVCPKCGRMYSDSGGLWVCCDGCNQWFHLKCTNIKKRNIPDFYYCENCVDSI